MAVWSRILRGGREDPQRSGSDDAQISETEAPLHQAESDIDGVEAQVSTSGNAKSTGAGDGTSGVDSADSDSTRVGELAGESRADRSDSGDSAGLESGRAESGSEDSARRGSAKADVDGSSDATPPSKENLAEGGSKLGRRFSKGFFPSGGRRSEAVRAEEPTADAVDYGLVRAWLNKFPPRHMGEPLLDFDPHNPGYIDLSQAHPSGLAQLLTSRRTRLSTLIRESTASSRALSAARTLRTKIHELGSERGIDAGYLAAGVITWNTSESGTRHTISAPVMLLNVLFDSRPGQNDYELQLLGQARLNPALVRELHTQYGIDIDPVATARMAYSTARFDPQPVLDYVRTATAAIPGVKVSNVLNVGAFADLGKAQFAGLEKSELVADLARTIKDPSSDSLATAPINQSSAPNPWRSTSFVALDERSPQDEFMVLDADANQQLVLDVINAGKSAVVSAPPATGGTQTAINAVASLAYQRKRVLVVAQRRATLTELQERMGALGLGSLVLSLSAQTGPTQLRNALLEAILRNEKAQQPKLGNLHTGLAERRHQLVEHLASLRNVRARWGCSPYQAMQSLAELTSINPAPATTVRLKRSVLDSIKDRSELGSRLRRAAELGSFSPATSTSPWTGARLLTRKEADQAHALAQKLAVSVPALHDEMDKVSEFSQVQHGDTVTQWGDLLELLGDVRESLDRFTPDIFDAPVTDLISATAPSSWRRDNELEMPAMQRSRLRRVAREYVRPGVHLDDLHSALTKVQAQAKRWATLTTSQRHPAVPSGMAALRERYNDVVVDIDKLSAAVEWTKQGGALHEVPVAELEKRLTLLAAEDESLATLPERTLLEEQMREQGLGDLLDDLARRHVGAAQTRSELELAWWQSALEAMISGDDYLAMADGDSLRRLEAEYRLADQAHIESGASRLRWRLAQDWAKAVQENPEAARYLRSMLKDGRVTLDDVVKHALPLLAPLVPISTISPYLVGSLLPSSEQFDAVVILDAHSLALEDALSVLGRGKQIVAFGDAALPGPEAFSLTVSGSEAKAQTPRVSVYEALGTVLPTQTLRHVYRSADEDLANWINAEYYDGGLSSVPEAAAINGVQRTVNIQYLPDGTGLPSSDSSGVEGVQAEVNRVVQDVFAAAQEHPRQSLAVVTASAIHAARVAEAIRLNMAAHPGVSEFFESTSEPFRVVTLDRCASLVRDRIIFSLGFGRTPHGRALHHFGMLSEPGGRGKFLTAVTRARVALEVVSCFKPDDLDTAKLSHGARDFYDLMDRELNSGQSGKGRPRPSTNDLDEDPLVADLADRLRARDSRVWYNYEDQIDIVAAADPVRMLTAEPEDVPAPVAVLSDGSNRYARLSVRERSRLRPQQLELHGWRYSPLWTIEVFTDPSGCADRISTFLGIATVSGSEGTPTAHSDDAANQS